MEFLAYMSIFINERNGDLVSKSELYGMKGHPGISYLFDAFEITTSGGRSFRKASYNRGPNKLSGQSFVDGQFNTTHGGLPLSERLKDTDDPVWSGMVYPQSTFPFLGIPRSPAMCCKAIFSNSAAAA
jgi:hypothetical protein